jgi:hypothetical protein
MNPLQPFPKPAQSVDSVQSVQSVQAQTVQYASVVSLLGTQGTYPAGTLFNDNGDGTCSPVAGQADKFGVDVNFFVIYNAASPLPLPGATFYSLDGQGNVIQVANDGTSEPKALIAAGLFWFDQASAQAALTALLATPKSQASS